MQRSDDHPDDTRIVVMLAGKSREIRARARARVVVQFPKLRYFPSLANAFES